MELEWKMLKGTGMAQQLDVTRSITSTQNNGVHGTHFGLHMSLSWISH
jgi:hypothetical protein